MANWLESFIKREAQEESELAQKHFDVNIVDSKAVGEQVQSAALDMYATEGGALVELTWSPAGTKLASLQFTSAEDAANTFNALQAKLLGINKMILENKMDEAKQASDTLIEQSKNMSPAPMNQATDQTPTNTQAGRKYQVSIIYPEIDKQAKATVQNLFFSTVQELISYQEQMKALMPSSDAGTPTLPPTGAPSGDLAEGPLTNTPAKPSALEKMIDQQVSEKIESSLENKARAIFEDAHAETVKVLRKLGRSWEEIKDFFNRYLKYDWDDIDVFLDQFIKAEEGTIEPINPGVEKVKQEMSMEPEDAPPVLNPESEVGKPAARQPKVDKQSDFFPQSEGLTKKAEPQWWCLTCGKEITPQQQQECYQQKHNTQLLAEATLYKQADLVRYPDSLKVGDKVQLVRSVMSKENTIIPVEVSGTIIRVSPYEVVIKSASGTFTLSKPDCAKLDKIASLAKKAQALITKYYLHPDHEYDWEADLVDEINQKYGPHKKKWDFDKEGWEVQYDGEKPYVNITLKAKHVDGPGDVYNQPLIATKLFEPCLTNRHEDCIGEMEPEGRCGCGCHAPNDFYDKGESEYSEEHFRQEYSPEHDLGGEASLEAAKHTCTCGAPAVEKCPRCQHWTCSDCATLRCESSQNKVQSSDQGCINCKCPGCEYDQKAGKALGDGCINCGCPGCTYDREKGLLKKADLDVPKALGEVQEKSNEQINRETAYTWGSRAAACYQLAEEASEEKSKDDWKIRAEDFRHEALEHAALVEDEGKLVKEIQDLIKNGREASASLRPSGISECQGCGNPDSVDSLAPYVDRNNTTTRWLCPNCVPSWKREGYTLKEASLEVISYIKYTPGHTDSRGEPAPWTIRSHEDDHVISSHQTKEEAEAHLKNMRVFKHMKSCLSSQFDKIARPKDPKFTTTDRPESYTLNLSRTNPDPGHIMKEIPVEIEARAPKYKVGDKVTIAFEAEGSGTITGINEIKAADFKDWFLGTYNATPGEVGYSLKGPIYSIKLDNPAGMEPEAPYYASEAALTSLSPLNEPENTPRQANGGCSSCGEKTQLNGRGLCNKCSEGSTFEPADAGREASLVQTASGECECESLRCPCFDTILDKNFCGNLANSGNKTTEGTSLCDACAQHMPQEYMAAGVAKIAATELENKLLSALEKIKRDRPDISAVIEQYLNKEMGLAKEARGERQKIRELKDQLHKEKNPAKIKSLCDAIDSLESRMDKEQGQKEKRREKKEKDAKEAQEAATAEAEKPQVAAEKAPNITIELGDIQNSEVAIKPREVPEGLLEKSEEEKKNSDGALSKLAEGFAFSAPEASGTIQEGPPAVQKIWDESDPVAKTRIITELLPNTPEALELQHKSWKHLSTELQEALSKYFQLGVCKRASNIQPMDRVERFSNGATGTTLAVNDNKPGDIDVCVYWDEPHEGAQVFEVDLGDIKKLDTPATSEQQASAETARTDFLKAREQYEADFNSRIKEQAQ